MAMLAVVLFHCLCFYGWWPNPDPDIKLYMAIDYYLDNITMPLFFLISGFLYAYLKINKNKYQNSREFIRKKTVRLLVPYIFWGGYLVIFFPFPSHTVKDFLIGICHLWFLLILFLEFLLFQFTYNYYIKYSKKQSVAILISLFLVSLCFDKYFSSLGISYRYYYTFSLVLHNATFFYMGILLFKYKLGEQLKSNSLRNAIVLSFVYFICICFIHHAKALYSVFFSSLIILCIFYYSEDFCTKYRKLCSHKIVESLDKCSMGIYIFHHLIIERFVYTPSVGPFMDRYYYIAPFLMYIVAVLLSWLLTSMFRRLPIRILIGA